MGMIVFRIYFSLPVHMNLQGIGMTDLEIEKQLGFILQNENVSYESVVRIFDLIKRVKRDITHTERKE